MKIEMTRSNFDHEHNDNDDISPEPDEQTKEARKLVFEFYHLECAVSSEKNTQYFHHNERLFKKAEKKLIEWGILKPEQCLRK